MRMSTLAGAAMVLAATTACVHEMSPARVSPGPPPAPGVPWTPPAALAGSQPPASKPAQAPTDLIESAEHWGLADLIDLALRNSPRTREAWAQARSAAAALGSERGDRYPTVFGQLDRTSVKGSAVGGLFTFSRQSMGWSANLTWLLFDFGGRSSSIEMARQALIAADWTHNAVIQDVVLDVQRAYYQYLYTRTLLAAEQANVKEAQTNLDAATQRREAGVATIADVLQAKTALSQAQLALQTSEGQIQTIKGALATAVGLPANTPYDIEEPAGDLPVQEFSEQVDSLIEEAQRKRPDLSAARSRVLEAEAKIRNVRATGLPSLVTNWSTGGIYYSVLAPTNRSIVETYNGALLLRVPIFNGLSLQYDLIRAREDAEAAKARLDTLSQDIVSQVWADYYNVQTASKRIQTTRDLLDSAQQSYEVALGRYKAGVGSILDLLTSQTALDGARAQQALARADWHLSLAQLAHDTGTLDIPTEPDSAKEGTP